MALQLGAQLVPCAASVTLTPLSEPQSDFVTLASGCTLTLVLTMSDLYNQSIESVPPSALTGAGALPLQFGVSNGCVTGTNVASLTESPLYVNVSVSGVTGSVFEIGYQVPNSHVAAAVIRGNVTNCAAGFNNPTVTCGSCFPYGKYRPLYFLFFCLFHVLICLPALLTFVYCVYVYASVQLSA